MAWLPPAVLTAALSEPLTVADAKAQCLVRESDFDSQFAGYIKTARAHVEAYCGIRLISQTLALRASRFGDLCHLPVAPVQSVTQIQYLDTNGTLQTLAPDQYEAVLVGLEPEIRPAFNKAWPLTRQVSDAVLVTVVCGYGTASAVPDDIRHAQLLLIADWFKQREDTIAERSVTPTEFPNGVRALLENYRRF